jgi:hypothetical protein
MVYLLALAACVNEPEPVETPSEGPLGIPIAIDGITWAGAAVIDVTPDIGETFTDQNGNHDYDEDEPFDDLDGDGVFEPVWIGGFGPLRPALDVHDPITVRAVVLAHDGEYVAFVSSDYVGLHHVRIHPARDALAADGFDPDRFVGTSSHNHQGPDTLGLWGNPLAGIPGFDEDYQKQITSTIETAVRTAAADMKAVDLKVGATNMRERSIWFNGANFGGKNPDPIFHGMIHDGRDPVVVSDQLLVMQAEASDGVVFTFTNWSGHPEVRGSTNNSLSADWVGVHRDVLEDEYGGVAIHLAECLGGMQSALGGELPLVQEDGTHVFDGVDDDGDEVPVWAERDSWEFVTSHGWHIAEAAMDVLEDAETYDATPIRLDWETIYFPVEAELYTLLAPSGIFDVPVDEPIYDPILCPEVGLSSLGCLDARTARIEVGPVGFITAPGELFPELAWGLPGDNAWLAEVDDRTARGPGSVYFPQHDHRCDALSAYTECVEETEVGTCDCTRIHTWPYRISDNDALPPLLDYWQDKPFRAIIGAGDTYLSYIVPQPDYNQAVVFPGDGDGDHYEDTVSPSSFFGERLLEAHATIDERW